MGHFEEAIKVILTQEGGYVNNPHDPGGETKFGITKASYPDLDIKNLTEEQAKKIYQEKFWQPSAYDRIQDHTVATKIFSLAVNMGSKEAHTLTQRALRSLGCPIKEDGILGDETFKMINEAVATSLLAALRSEAAGYYRLVAAAHPTEQVFLTGWLNRAYT